MKKFNLRKKASATDDTVSDKRLDENRKNMNLSNEKQGVVEKNVNLSLPIKDKDNTVPFNQQLDAARKNELEVAITEAGMDNKIVDSKSKDKKQVMDINVKTQEFDDKKTEEYKKAEKEKRDTAFWDKFVGVQLEGEKTTVDKNIPLSVSQLPNNPDRFKGNKIKNMVMASLKDADAMLFHIYATAAREGRKLTKKEEQQVIDINSGKIRLMAQASLSGIAATDVLIKEELGKAGVYESGEKIDEFKSCEEAKTNYPEGEVINV